MNYLYAPVRANYNKKKENISEKCPFCKNLEIFENDEKNIKKYEHLILKKFKYTFVIMNLFPYNRGHLLVIPIEHTGDLNNLSKEARYELIEVSNIAIKILEDKLKFDGINLGFNKGKASGGSIPDHLHIHLVPRFLGDANFLTVISDTKLVSYNIKDIYDLLFLEFQNITLK